MDDFMNEDFISAEDANTPIDNNVPADPAAAGDDSGYAIGGAVDPLGENDPYLPVEEHDTVIGETEGSQTFEDIDAIPAFEDIEDDPELAALPVDADGIIQPIIVPDDTPVDPELGDIPDVVLPMEEPILDMTEDDVDVEIPDNAFENGGVPEGIPVLESFKLPENQRVVISKGDQIFLLGKVKSEFTPKFAESVFSRALKSLAESKGQSSSNFVKVSQKHEKVALVGRSILVEVVKDWMLPGTSTVFESHDLLQIVSAKPIVEGEEAEDDKAAEKDDSADKKNKDEDEDVEKNKKEALAAYRRWKEAEKKRRESGADDNTFDDAVEDELEKAEKERQKREEAFLARQRSGGLI